jgi:hypothetical protein
MTGRETEYERGFIQGVAAMMELITTDTVKTLDKTNVLSYAIKLIKEWKEDNDR